MKILTHILTYILIYVICLLMGGGSFLSAVPTKSEIVSLEQMMELALQHNLALKISEMDKKIAMEEYRTERALPNPELEYAWGTMDIPGETVKPKIWSLGGKLEIPNPIHRHFMLKALKKDVTEAEIDAHINKREIIKNLKNHYFQLAFLMKQKEFMDERDRILQEVNRITRAKVSIGEAKEIDALRAGVEIQKNMTHRFKVEKLITFERAKIVELLNNKIPRDFAIDYDFAFQPLVEVETKLDQLIESSPEIRKKKNHVAKTRAYATAAPLSLLEGFELFAEQEKEAEGKKWKVGIGVSIPLFNWKTAAIRKAGYEKEKAKLDLAHDLSHFLADMNHKVNRIRILEKEIETYRGAILTEGRENMMLSERLYLEGEVDLIVFLDSQNSFYEIQERYYEAMTEWNGLKAELEALLGETL